MDIRAIRLALVAMVIIITLGLMGCSGVDPLSDPGGGNYSALLTLAYQFEEEEETLQVDTSQSICSVDSATGEITYDFFSESFGYIEITASSEAAGMTLESYTIEYIPKVDSDAVGGPFTAPDLAQPLPRNVSVYIAPGETVELYISLVSVSTKYEFNQKMGWTYNSTLGVWVIPSHDVPQDATYDIRVTLRFVNTDVELIAERSGVYFSDFAYCE